MMRDYIDFKTFDEQFIQQAEGGFYPVCIELQENDNGTFSKVVELDMICEWRLQDSKIKFIEVPFETEEQLEKILNYGRLCADFLRKSIMDSADTTLRYYKEETSL